MDTTIQNIAPTDDSIVTSTDLNPDETDMAVALMANDRSSGTC